MVGGKEVGVNYKWPIVIISGTETRRAYLLTFPHLWGVGKTDKEALGDLVIKHPWFFRVEIVSEK